jgi:RNA polymerase sigma-70 factor (ECF subfamily)
VWLVPAWLEGREAIAVFEHRDAAKPSYFMWLEWADDRVRLIHDYRHVSYVVADAELMLAPDAKSAGDAVV